MNGGALSTGSRLGSRRVTVSTAASTDGAGRNSLAGSRRARRKHHHGRPTRADEVDGGVLAGLRQRASDLPLHDEIRAHDAAGRIIEQPVQERRRAIERRVGEHPVRSGRQWELDGVAFEDGDGVGRREAPREPGGEHGVDFDGEHRRAAVREGRSERAGAGAELDDLIRGAIPASAARRAASAALSRKCCPRSLACDRPGRDRPGTEHHHRRHGRVETRAEAAAVHRISTAACA